MLDIPCSLVSSLKESPFDNNYFQMYTDMRKSLDRVVSGKDTYSSYHYSMLINNLELYLKGYLSYKLKMGEWTEPHPHYLTEDHKIMKLIDQVKKFVPLFNDLTSKEWSELQKFVSGVCRQYTTARYSIYVPYEDFLQLNNDFINPLITKINNALIEKKEPEIEFEFGL